MIAAFGRRWNDDLDDEDRQRLKPFIPRLVGTMASPEVETARSWMCVDWLVHTHLPTWLRLAGMDEQVVAVEALPILASSSWPDAKPLLGEIRSAARRRQVEARAALAAKMRAAQAAGPTRAAEAAEAAEILAAYRQGGHNAAYWRARDLIRPKVEAALAEKLEPTKTSLQESALDLLDRMIAAGQDTPVMP